MIKKLKNQRGVTIAEMLTAVALLALLTAGGITVASGVLASYNRMKEAANADILASTVIEAISNEVRLGHGPSIGASDGILQLDSAFFGEDAALQLDAASGHLVAVAKDPAGGTATQKELLSADTYGTLHLDALKFTMDAAPVCAFEFSVLNDSGQELWHNSASASPLQ